MSLERGPREARRQGGRWPPRTGAALRGLIVLGGVGAAALTVLARRAGDLEWARAGAFASLVFVVLLAVFVVPPLVGGAREEARQLDLPFQITVGGLAFVGVLLVVAFAAWNTGNNLLYLVLSVLTSALFVAWTAARVSLRDLSVSARFPDHIFAGEPAPVLVSLHNAKRVLPSFSVLVEARGYAEGENARPPDRRRRHGAPRFRNVPLAYFMYAPRGARAEQRVEQTFPRRGRVVVAGFDLSTRFPFGLFRLRRRLRARQVEIVVYPRPEPAGDELHLLPTNAGRVASARRGAGHDLHSLRDYQAHDNVRHIDWKATARTRRLTVREFTAEDERRVHIVLDTRLHAGAGRDEEGAGPDDRAAVRRRSRDNVGNNRGVERGGGAPAGDALLARFERGVTLAASLVKHFIDEGAEVRLTLGEESGRYGEGREHLYACLRRLALVNSSDGGASDAQRLQGAGRSNETPRDGYDILLTTAPPGSIPAHLWRHSHVIHL